MTLLRQCSMQPKQPSGHTYRIFAEVKRGLPDIEYIVILRDRFTNEVLKVYQRKRQNVNKKFMTMSSFPLIYLDPHKRSKNGLKKINPTVKSVIFLECPKSLHGKNAKFTFFIIKGALFT